MPNQSPSRSGRLYITQETTFMTAVAPTGSNACRFIDISPEPDVQLIDRPDKTGDLDPTPGTSGKRTAKIDLSMSLAPNGSAGVVSDANLLFKAFFGQAPTIVAATSVTYTLAAASATPLSLNLYHYRLPSTVNQQASLGTIVNSINFEVDGTGNAASIVKFGCMAGWITESNAYSALDSIGKGGLGGSFPAEPGSPVTSGNMVVNYKGLFKVGSNSFSNLRKANFTLNANRSMVDDTFGTDYATGINSGLRDFSGTMEMYDQDDANTAALWTSSITKTPIDLTLQIGTVAGAITTIILKNVQMASPKQKTNGDRNWSFEIGKSRATATSIGANDSLSIAQT